MSSGIAQGVRKQLRYAKQAGLGAIAATTGGSILRRTQSTLDLNKTSYQATEIRSDYQVADFRLGTRSVAGDISGELSPGTYADLIAGVLRSPFAAGVTTGAQTTIAASAVAPHFTRTAGSFLADGFKVGDVIRASGFTHASNNNTNFMLVDVEDEAMTVVQLNGPVGIATEVSGGNVTLAVAGKKAIIPSSGFADTYFTFEHWFSDIAQSEVFTDCKVSQLDLSLPATGMSTIKAAVMGLNMQTGQAAYFTAPAPETTSGILAAVNGVVLSGGKPAGIVTGATLTVNGTLTTGAVVGSNVMPDVFDGTIKVSGQITAYFQDAKLRDQFVNETESSLSFAMTTSNAPNADFLAFTLPRIKVSSAKKDDGEKGLSLTIPFTALKNIAGGAGTASDATTVSFQDSLA
ncbi:phage tail tube protein [Burkholderia ubonensis]|uniref:Uncharacterized protein n=1 Tax=Burkholderia ubonensis TaxID=101571 RepID=A0ABD4EAT5_9BURK|nr:phage tail tube protein [Burkholderia ubonensis]KVN92537.1 hypothetical protein WJ68_33480 [Burkholderia ubonensis]